MSNLQLLVESIVTDLVNARFEADLKAAELAEQYRENPAMRALSVPTLNISNVSVELRMVFDDSAVTPADQPSDEQTSAIAVAAERLRDSVMRMNSVRTGVTVASRQTALSQALADKTKQAATRSLNASAAERRSALDSEVKALLTLNRLTLAPAEQRALAIELARFEATVAAAPKPVPKVLPQVVVGAQALSNARPEVISTLKFDINLNEARWTEVDDGAGGTRSILSGD